MQRNVFWIQLENPAADFGVIFEGEKVTHKFICTNPGPDDVKIVTVKSTCGCSIPGWSRDSIPPGSTGEVTVIFDSSFRSGLQVKELFVLTEEPQKAMTKLTLIAKIDNPVVARPSSLLFDLEPDAKKETIEKTANISLDKGITDLSLVRTEGDFFKADLKKAKKSGEYVLKLETQTPEKPGSYDGQVILAFRGNRSGEKIVDVRVILQEKVAEGHEKDRK